MSDARKVSWASKTQPNRLRCLVVTSTNPSMFNRIDTSMLRRLLTAIGLVRVQVYALLGSARHQYKLAVRYHRGEGVNPDLAKAAIWCQRAAEAGYAPAEYLLANSYIAGLGVARDQEKAYSMYRRAAEHGELNGKHALAWCYEQGVGIEKNAEAAFEIWLSAANEGLADSQWAVAGCYFHGNGVAKDLMKAQNWCRAAIAAGVDPEANELLRQIQEAITADKAGSN